MISFIIGLFVGDFLGCFIGVALMALLAMARDPEPPKREPEQKEPTILWTVGNICKWGGEVHEIRFFRQDKDGHTLACILTDGATMGVCVPIEELEAVEE